MKNITISKLKEILLKCYSEKTCANSYLEKFKTNRLAGQCVPTALVVQDYFGGIILRAEIEGEGLSHYFNKLDNGEIIDLTKGQFSKNVKYENITVRTKDNILNNPRSIEQYETLRDLVKNMI